MEARARIRPTANSIGRVRSCVAQIAPEREFEGLARPHKATESGSGGIGQRARRGSRRARSWRERRREAEPGRQNWDAHRFWPGRFRSRER